MRDPGDVDHWEERGQAVNLDKVEAFLLQGKKPDYLEEWHDEAVSMRNQIRSVHRTMIKLSDDGTLSSTMLAAYKGVLRHEKTLMRHYDRALEAKAGMSEPDLSPQERSEHRKKWEEYVGSVGTRLQMMTNAWNVYYTQVQLEGIF